MSQKHWIRVVALSLFLAAVFLLFRLWSPLGTAPQPRPRPGADTAQQKIEKAPPTSAARTKAARPAQVEIAESPEPPSTSEDVHTAQAPEAPPNQDPPTLEDLIRATEDPDWKARWDAVNALGERKDPRAIPALVQRALLDDNSHPRWRSLWALGRVDPKGSATIPSLITALQTADPVGRNAAVALAFFGQPEARPKLLNALYDRDPFRRWEAVFSLREVGSSEVARALTVLLDERVEPDEKIRRQAVLSLGPMKNREVILSLVNSLRRDQSSEVRWRAAMTLSRVGDSYALGELQQAMETETDPTVREHIENALTEIRKR